MNKERLAAFTDAILAIVMTILVLELEKPSEASWAALRELRQSFFSYAISFFWLGAMWVNIHAQWQRVEKIDNKAVWCSIVMLFFASLFPYVTDFVGKNFMSRVAQGAYFAVVLAVTFSNMALSLVVGRANRDDAELYAQTSSGLKAMWIDIAIKTVGFVLAMLVYPPLTLIAVILAGVMLTVFGHIPRKKLKEGQT